ncbi:MAG: endonuclease III [Alphaproteobacteria bacterium]|nr:endonuclease III [Alphaproteobacteria bacterium]
MRSKKDILAIMKIFASENPNPQCELHFHNPYTLLVAVMLSAQSTDKGVNKATEALFKIADSPQKILALGEEKLKDYIKTIGLFNNKAKNIMLMSKQLIEDFGGEVPADRDTLTTLAGVGRKTANVVMNVWYHQPTLAVDTHVMRIAHRLEFSRGKTPLEVETDLMKVLPPEFIINTNHWLVLFGRYICKAQKPLCAQCPIYDYCNCKDKQPRPIKE